MVAQAQDTSTPLSPVSDGRGRALTPQERGRLGGQATLARHGTEFYSRIGRVGFRAAVDAGYGAYLLGKLAPSYRAKFGRDPVLGRNKAGDKARADARQATPTLGRCAWPGCTTQATERHHVDGWKVSPETCGLCTPHHAALEKAYRTARTVYRPHSTDPVTKRAVALSIGIGLDDSVPF